MIIIVGRGGLVSICGWIRANAISGISSHGLLVVDGPAMVDVAFGSSYVAAGDVLQ